MTEASTAGPPPVIHAALRPPEHRIPRECNICHQWDDHPHHMVFTAGGVVLSNHHDCCAANSCPAEEGLKCADLLATAPEGAKQGLALAAHLQTDPLAHVVAAREAATQAAHAARIAAAASTGA